MKHVVSSFVCCGVALAAGIASADGDLEKLVDETYRRLTDERVRGVAQSPYPFGDVARCGIMV